MIYFYILHLLNNYSSDAVQLYMYSHRKMEVSKGTEENYYI